MFCILFTLNFFASSNPYYVSLLSLALVRVRVMLMFYFHLLVAHAYSNIHSDVNFYSMSLKQIVVFVKSRFLFSIQCNLVDLLAKFL